jgi:DNA-binding GntR family transcriptional regulator
VVAPSEPYHARSVCPPVDPPDRFDAARPLPAPGEQLQRRSSGDRAALYIRRLIFDGELRPGARVPQDDVARSMGISRIPVREALIALEREGWVTIQMHRGAFVNALDERAVRDHFDLYGLTYGFSVERAAERGGAELVRRLDAQEQVLAAARDPEAVWQAAVGFHAAVVEATRSPRLKVVLRAMSGMIPGNFFAQVPGSIETEKAGIAEVAAAVRAGDAGRAAEVYRRTMRAQGDHVVALLESRGLLQPLDA